MQKYRWHSRRDLSVARHTRMQEWLNTEPHGVTEALDGMVRDGTVRIGIPAAIFAQEVCAANLHIFTNADRQAHT